MKTNLILLFALTIGGSCGCTDSIPGSDPDGGETSALSLAVDFDDRPYEYGELVDLDLVVTELGATADHCYLTAKCEGGAASLTVAGEAVSWNERHPVYYGLLGEGSASATLRCSVLPAAAPTVEQTLSLELLITNEAHTAVTTKRIPVRTKNTHPIHVSARYDTTPIEINMALDILLSATKEGFNGEFTLTPTYEMAKGVLLCNGKEISADSEFHIPATSECFLQYQAATSGVHRLDLTLSDGVYTASTKISCEVFNQGGVTKPPKGIYIYAEGLFYTRTRWNDNKPDVKAEGVAVIADACQFLIALSDVTSSWHGSRDNITKIANLPNCEDPATAALDCDGLQNTRAILAALDAGIITSADAARACYYYDKSNPGRWYLPAAGQMSLLLADFAEIQQCLRQIDYYATLKTGTYYTSTRKNTYVWALLITDYKQDFTGYNPIAGASCRPVRTL